MSRLVTYLFAGVFFRLCLFLSNFSQVFQKRVEISTPLNSWLQVQEGLYLTGKDVNPYTGDTYHETPLFLLIADYLRQLPQFLLYMVFILGDILTASFLAFGVEEARKFYLMKSQEAAPTKNRDKDKDKEKADDLDIKTDDNYAEHVMMAYMLNPFTIFNCVGLTTTVWANLSTSLAIYSMIKGHRYLSGFAIALSTYQSLYPVSLLFPMAICIYNREKWTKDIDKKIFILTKEKLCPYGSVFKSIVAFVIPFLALLFMSKIYITKDWEFLERTYGFILNVQDLKPNIGLFWYFFTEMFEHFHVLFICTFQINAFIYVIPLTIRFFDEPALIIYSLCSLMAIFKSYPAAGDVGFYLALLPMWKHLLPFMQQKFLVCCFFVATTVLAPIQWFLWIYSGSANANFYFGVTIAFGTAQIFLLTDVLLAYLKREFYLKNGKSKEVDGKPAILSLM